MDFGSMMFVEIRLVQLVKRKEEEDGGGRWNPRVEWGLQVGSWVSPLGISYWKLALLGISLKWLSHSAIPHQLELKCNIEKEKLRAHTNQRVWNMNHACVLFNIDKMRKKSMEERENMNIN
ncbi:LOW QUALITY PROTEIN: hypothetical protein OSB04_007200 [Centaurea solstitialis]|uniref:Uncharacterized protein n=1 Tax=Centaurea solstitialis TaxID=347529 RepID=A0AA38WQR3_9ASTR|nr:LOW QUALITY PROTEIN: hypothetical protein OSB04_007200 [Centaurea solstitialis]